jgi:hypothetical protein
MTIPRTAIHPQASIDPASEGFLDAIREGFAYVAQQARHVRIREDRLPAYALSLPNEPPANIFDSSHHYFGTPEDTAACTLILNAINFGSGFSNQLEAEGWPMVDHSIYYSISTSLKRFFETEGPLSARALMEIDQDRIRSILELPAKGAASEEFAGLCARSLREFGGLVQDRHGGSCLQFVEAMQGSAERLAATLGQLESFHDVHAYRGRMVPFYKRAQISAGELQLAFERLGIVLFSDMKRLTMFPDNGVPHVLRIDGILEYAPALAAKIDAGEFLASGSEEEIEIRACAGHAVEILAALKGAAATDIDFLLWHRSVEDEAYQKTPTHMTKTIFY